MDGIGWCCILVWSNELQISSTPMKESLNVKEEQMFHPLYFYILYKRNKCNALALPFLIS